MTRARSSGVRRRADCRTTPRCRYPLVRIAARHVQRAVDQRRALHVDPDEAAAGVGVGQDALQIVAAQSGVELEPELRQLHRQVAGHAGEADRLDHPQVGDRGRLGRFRAADVLAQVVERVEQTAPFQPAGRVDGFVDVPAADEAARDAVGTAHAVPRGGVLERTTSRQREEQPAREDIQHGRGGEIH